MIEIIIVLGNSTDGIYQKRVDRAVEYFNSKDDNEIIDYEGGDLNVKRYILFSGVKKNVENMYDYALSKLGDPSYKRFLLKESKSRNTVQNILFSMDVVSNTFMIEANFQDTVTLTVCTSKYHIKRSIIITNLLCKKFNTKFIYTNDPITPEQEYSEEVNTRNFLNSYASTCLNA